MSANLRVKFYFWPISLVCFLVVLGERLHAADQPYSFHGQWFLHYASEDVQEGKPSAFYLSRGYLTLKTKVSPWLSGRITIDTRQKDNGDYALRLKYLYAKVKLPEIKGITSPAIEMGLVHRAWLDFEEHLNYYRVQGTMFQERFELFNSADAGVTFNTLLGGYIDEKYQQEVNPSYPGRYGSLAIGIYNGGGYHAVEMNNDKNLEVRVTLRPLPGIIPGVQISGFWVRGTGNLTNSPTFSVNTLFLSYESRHATVTYTSYQGSGNQSGELTENQEGKSIFLEWKVVPRTFSFFLRHDSFDPDRSHSGDDDLLLILGAAYHLGSGSKFLLDLERRGNKEQFLRENTVFKTSLEFHF